MIKNRDAALANYKDAKNVYQIAVEQGKKAHAHQAKETMRFWQGEIDKYSAPPDVDKLIIELEKSRQRWLSAR